MVASTYRRESPTRIRRECQLCGSVFWVRPCEIQQGRGKFCSVDCARPATVVALTESNKNRSMAVRSSVTAQTVPAVPTINIPNRRVRVRFTGACPYCGGTMFEAYLPPADVEHVHVTHRGDVSCLLCGREVAKLAIGGAA